MGRELNKMDLTLRLTVVDYCMRRYEARVLVEFSKSTLHDRASSLL